MSTIKLVAVLFLAVTLCCCKSATEATNTGGAGSVLGSMRMLSAVNDKFVELAKATPGKSPGDILVLTADWVKSQPDVADAWWYDSAYIEIKMKSGLRTTFMLFRAGADGLSATRGGDPIPMKGGFTGTTTSANVITNKNVLIYAPFVSGSSPEIGDLYREGELDKLVDLIKNSGKDLNVTLHEYSSCTLNDVDSFGYYGLVILSTHGIPDAFFSGQFLLFDPKIDSTEALIKEQTDYTLGPGGYEKVSAGDLRFCHAVNIASK
jgi:hypothetical protein